MTRRKRVTGVKVFKLKCGLENSTAYFSLACRNHGQIINGWSYDPRTGKARVF